MKRLSLYYQTVANCIKEKQDKLIKEARNKQLTIISRRFLMLSHIFLGE